MILSASFWYSDLIRIGKNKFHKSKYICKWLGLVKIFSCKVFSYAVHVCFDLSCPPPEFYRLLDSIIKKQGIYHATDKGTGKSSINTRSVEVVPRYSRFYVVPIALSFVFVQY